eukprot:786276-Prymnesium_polylepis.1
MMSVLFRASPRSIVFLARASARKKLRHFSTSLARAISLASRPVAEPGSLNVVLAVIRGRFAMGSPPARMASACARASALIAASSRRSPSASTSAVELGPASAD